MPDLQQIVFIIVFVVAIYLITKRFRTIKQNILLGKPEERKGNRRERLRNMLLIAFGQKKMFKKPLPAFLHLLVYVGFIIINIEVLEFIIDGVLGSHRVFANYLGGLYPILMNVFEFLAVGVLFSCLIFLIRRNLLKLDRFHKPEMSSWPKLDANIILITEIALMLAILNMNAADQILQQRGVENYNQTGHLYFSGLFIPFMEGFNTSTIIAIERGSWWFHIVGILSFAVYVTYSKHLHIFLAFPNTYYADLDPKGKIDAMDSVTNEVKIMLGLPGDPAPASDPIERFGAKDITDLSWKSIMDSYSCTECGRCTEECPANQTGKKLSPRKIMMDVRDRADEIGTNRKSGKNPDDGKSLLGDYVTNEEINACTTCNACVEACPIMINPMKIIIEMRRYVAMEESGSPAEWNSMFQNIETSFSPWKFPPTDRSKWSKNLSNK